MVGVSGVVAMTSAGTQRVNGDEHTWPGNEAGADGVAQTDVDVVARADVADRRKTRHERTLGELRRPERRLCDGAAQPAHRVCVPVVRRLV